MNTPSPSDAASAMAQHCRELLLLSRGDHPFAGAPNDFLAPFVRGHVDELDRLRKSSREAIEATGEEVARVRAAAGHVPLYSVSRVSGKSAHEVAARMGRHFWQLAWNEANRHENAVHAAALEEGREYTTVYGDLQLLELHGEAIGVALARTPYLPEDMDTLAAAVKGEELLLGNGAGRGQKVAVSDGGKTPSISQNTERDQWMYDQACAGRPYKDIFTELKKKAAKKRWRLLGAERTVHATIHRFANANGLPSPPPRKPRTKSARRR